jgi:glycosyltransferase involved in cell wall biosynthesis
MPVYNESRTLRTIVSRVLASPVEIPMELVCVDDCSTDGSHAILQSLASADSRIKVFRQASNQGKGAAIQLAIQQMTGDIALIQDADLEYDPRDYPALIAPILENKADAVFGSRFCSAGQRKILLFWHSVANRALTLMTNMLNDVNITDMETCYKAIRADILKQIPLKSKRFGIEPELTTRIAQWNIRLYEVPVSYHGRTAAEGKKIGFKDAISALWCLFKYRFIDTRFTTHDGFYILQSVRRAKGFNRWMLSQFRPYIGKRVLEAGCGIGNFTEQLLDRDRLLCVDYDPFYVEMIDRRFGHLENVKVLRTDLTLPEQYGEIINEDIDTIICLNVVEHIEADTTVLENYHEALVPGGHAVILVPAQPWLYSACDKALGHFRRYTTAELRTKMANAGFEVVSVHQFNRLGVAGWWVNKILGRADLSPRQMQLYELLLIPAKILDFLRIGPGLSVIAVGRKPVLSPKPETVSSEPMAMSGAS